MEYQSIDRLLLLFCGHYLAGGRGAGWLCIHGLICGHIATILNYLDGLVCVLLREIQARALEKDERVSGLGEGRWGVFVT